jgi:hypothetical protein
LVRPSHDFGPLAGWEFWLPPQQQLSENAVLGNPNQDTLIHNFLFEE